MRPKRVITVDDERLAARYEKGLVSIIDDDVSVLRALEDLIHYEGYACETYRSVAEFIDAQSRERFPGPRCVLSDMYMPDQDGLALKASLPADSDQVVVFMSGMSDINRVSRAFRMGALNFLCKPLDDQIVFDAIAEALEQSERLQLAHRARAHQERLAARLTPREREVASLIPQGLPIKVIAARLGISDRAVKIHKHNVMQKLQIRSAFELVRLVADRIL